MPLAPETLFGELARREPFADLARDGVLGLPWCVRILNRWESRSGQSALRWQDVLTDASIEPSRLAEPSLTHTVLVWTRSRRIDGRMYEPPGEGYPDRGVRHALHDILVRHSPNGVLCAYWLSGSEHAARLARFGRTLTLSECEYAVVRSTMPTVDRLVEETLQYPEWIVEESGAWALCSDKDSPFIDLAGSDEALLAQILALDLETYRVVAD